MFQRSKSLQCYLYVLLFALYMFYTENVTYCKGSYDNFYRAELETKRILLEIFKERQQKNAEAGTIPNFYKKAWNWSFLCGLCFIFLIRYD